MKPKNKGENNRDRECEPLPLPSGQKLWLAPSGNPHVDVFYFRFFLLKKVEIQKVFPTCRKVFLW